MCEICDRQEPKSAKRVTGRNHEAHCILCTYQPEDAPQRERDQEARPRFCMVSRSSTPVLLYCNNSSIPASNFTYRPSRTLPAALPPWTFEAPLQPRPVQHRLSAPPTSAESVSLRSFLVVTNPLHRPPSGKDFMPRNKQKTRQPPRLPPPKIKSNKLKGSLASGVK